MRQGELLGLTWAAVDLTTGLGRGPRVTRPPHQCRTTTSSSQTPGGDPLDGRDVTQKRFRAVLEKAGVPRIRFHDLRHTYATLQLTAGTHPKLVQEVLGHSTIALTLDVYSHVTPTMHDEAAATIERLLGGAGTE